ncbi:MAG: hypothetical protein JWR33_708 [Naasia sp.]|jgi:molecular chaperone GrpE (heat shock protein)|uniref:DUF6752 domain-containing protein n=1 Tax=Naasia sp. TaxID=2546198 RepID=UPI00261882AF|nr:DUF6752 domain-containing protein [Naasia sp.]MCU1569967.1 hypothetical protein [Naasia sp.]
MENFLGRILYRIAPRTAEVVKFLVHAGEESGGMMERVLAYENEVKELRKEIDELRADSRRVAELYDLVFERLERDRTS